MPDNEDRVTAMSVSAAVPVSDLDASIGWYSRLNGRAPDSRPMDGLADYFLASDRDRDRGTEGPAVGGCDIFSSSRCSSRRSFSSSRPSPSRA